MIGEMLGHRPGHYFVVLTIEVDGLGYKSTQSRTDAPDIAEVAVAPLEADAGESQPPSGQDGSAPPEAEDSEDVSVEG